MWWLLTQFFGLRGRQEHHAKKMEDFQLCKNDEGMEFVQFTEGPTKTRQGGLQSKNRDFQPRMFSVGGERCPVAIFKQFVERRPRNMRWSSPFYLSIQGHPVDLFLKISVLHANFCWLGDVEEIIVLGRKVLLGKKIIQGVRGDLKSRIAATGYLYGLLATQDLNCAL